MASLPNLRDDEAFSDGRIDVAEAAKDFALSASAQSLVTDPPALEVHVRAALHVWDRSAAALTLCLGQERFAAHPLVHSALEPIALAASTTATMVHPRARAVLALALRTEATTWDELVGHNVSSPPAAPRCPSLRPLTTPAPRRR